MDVIFADHNKEVYSPTDPVTLHVYVKNVAKLTVKLFELNTTGIYLDTLREVSSAMNLVRAMVPGALRWSVRWSRSAAPIPPARLCRF